MIIEPVYCPVHGFPLPRRASIYHGMRTLVAKTCTQCGEFKDAKEFSRNREVYWLSECRRCILARYTHSPRQREDIQRIQAEHQAETMTPDAVQGRWTRWSNAEIEVALNDAISPVEAAKRLGRTYRAVLSARLRYGYYNDPKHKRSVR